MSNVLTFRKQLTLQEMVMDFILNQLASVGVSYPKNMSLEEFKEWLDAPETQWVVDVAMNKLNGGRNATNH